LEPLHVQVKLVTYLDKPMPDGTVTITSMQAISLGFVMPDAPNLPLNSMIPLEFIGRNEAGQTTLSQRSGYQLIMDGMGASSDLSRRENYAKREIVAQIRDVLVAHERDWHTSGDPVESYPGANAQAEAVRKMVNQAMSPDTCTGCDVVHVSPPAVASSATWLDGSWTIERPKSLFHSFFELNLKPFGPARRSRKARSLATNEAIFNRRGSS
jgi:hypothetical protein